MGGEIVLPLLQNVSLLALVAVGYAGIRRSRAARILPSGLWVGLLFGAGAVLAMSMRIAVAPGVFVDGRSALLGLSAIFGGLPGALIAGLIAAGYRLMLGGATTVSGIAGCLGAVLVSIAFMLLRRRLGFGLNPLSLYLLGFAVVTEGVASLLLLLPNRAADILDLVAGPLYLVIPLGTVLLGYALKSEDDRLALQSRLADQTDLLEAVFASMSDGVSVANRQGQIILVNPASTAMTGVTPTDRPGAEWAERYGVYELDGVTRLAEAKMPLYRALRGETSDNVELVMRNDVTDGDRILSVNGRPLRGADGLLRGGIVVFRDVTVQKRRERDLEAARLRMERQAADLAALAERLEVARLEADQANREKSRFLASMSHELRTPLNAILGFSGMISEEIFGPVAPARYRGYCEMIHDSGVHLLSLINDLLDLSKIEAGRMELRVERLESHALMAPVIAMMKPAATDRQIELDGAVEGECAAIHADPRAAKQILLNLLSNAIKFTPPGGRIRVRIRDAGAGGAEISVADTGIGMSPEEIARALQPYGQVENQLEIATKGTGLGLALVQSLAELHGGYLTVASEKGKGTTVSVFLPWVAGLAAAPARALPETPPAAPLLGAPTAETMRILLAEDNPMNQRMFIEILRGAGHAVDCVGDGIAAVERAAAQRYDLILMDVEMPELDGVCAAARIRAGTGRSSATPILALTANEGAEHEQRYRAAGMSGMVTKPVSVQALIDAVSANARRAA